MYLPRVPNNEAPLGNHTNIMLLTVGYAPLQRKNQLQTAPGKRL